MEPAEPPAEQEVDTAGRPSQKIEFNFNPVGAEETQSALVTPSSIPATPTVSEGEAQPLLERPEAAVLSARLPCAGHRFLIDTARAWSMADLAWDAAVARLNQRSYAGFANPELDRLRCELVLEAQGIRHRTKASDRRAVLGDGWAVYCEGGKLVQPGRLRARRRTNPRVCAAASWLHMVSMRLAGEPGLLRASRAAGRSALARCSSRRWTRCSGGWRWTQNSQLMSLRSCTQPCARRA